MRGETVDGGPDGCCFERPIRDPERDVETIDSLGGGFLVPGDEHWPAALNDLADAPLGLWYRGDITSGIAEASPCVSITRSRDATSYDAGWLAMSPTCSAPGVSASFPDLRTDRLPCTPRCLGGMS